MRLLPKPEILASLSKVSSANSITEINSLKWVTEYSIYIDT